MITDEKPFDPAAYAEEASAAIGLPIPAPCKPGVVANLARLAAMADALRSFRFPDDAQ